VTAGIKRDVDRVGPPNDSELIAIDEDPILAARQGWPRPSPAGARRAY
jgi:hypothetical protein